MGCSFTLAGALVVSLSLTNLIECARIGFVWPLEELDFMPDCPVPKPLCHGTMSTDDLALVVGGGLSAAKRKSSQCVLHEIRQSAAVLHSWAKHGTPWGAKCNAYTLHSMGL